jgi:hypothetical protein
MKEYLVEKSGKKKYITQRNEEAPENGKALSHSAHGNGVNVKIKTIMEAAGSPEMLISNCTTAKNSLPQDYNLILQWEPQTNVKILFYSHIHGVSKTFGERYQKTNKNRRYKQINFIDLQNNHHPSQQFCN